MINGCRIFLEHYEPIWLFAVLFFEAIISALTLTILIIEYLYDKELEESKSKRRRINKRRVKIIIDKDGQASITEAPKGLDIDISHEG